MQKCWLQVNCETDFLTRTADFQRTVAALAEAAMRIDPGHVAGASRAGKARSPAGLSQLLRESLSRSCFNAPVQALSCMLPAYSTNEGRGKAECAL